MVMPRRLVDVGSEYPYRYVSRGAIYEAETLCFIVARCTVSTGQSEQRSDIKETHIAGITVEVFPERCVRLDI